MRLCYFQSASGNFGDDLNPWLWQQLAPELLDDDDDTALIGMGTLLGEWFTADLPQGCRRIVLGTGGGKDRKLPEITADWSIYGVRGPLTAALLDLPSRLVLTDPAMAVRDLCPRPTAQRRGIGFMPHYFSVASWSWQQICDDLGLIYIDPHADPQDTLATIAGLEMLMTEAMHGAIVADAFRVPWIALKISPKHNSAKWDDWGGSLGEVTFFHSVPSLHDAGRVAGRGKQMKSWLKRQVRNAGGPRMWTLQPGSTRSEVDACRDRLRFILANDEPQLSRDHKLQEALDRFYSAVEALRRDWRSGHFRPHSTAAGVRQVVETT